MNWNRFGRLALILSFTLPWYANAATVYVGQTHINAATIVSAQGVSTEESLSEGCLIDTDANAISYYRIPLSGDLSGMPLHFAVQVPGGVLPTGTTWLANPADLIVESGGSFLPSINLTADPYGTAQPVSGVFPITTTFPADATDVTNVLIRAEFFGGPAPESCLVAVHVPEPTNALPFVLTVAACIAFRRRG